MSRSKPSADGLMRTLRDAARAVWTTAVRGARLAVGVPDYETYLLHCRRRHPDRPPMSRHAFFRERMEARYGRGRSRCC